MSAENAWRIAREAAAEFCAGYIGGPAVPHYDERAKVADDMCEALSFAFRSLPMPPAFRAAVEAETEELRGMLAEVRAWLDPRRSREVAATCARIDALSRLEAKGESQ